MKFHEPGLLLAALLLLLSCGSPETASHFEQALSTERDLLRSNPEAGYGHPTYVEVLRELDAVPRSSPQYSVARAMSQRISDGRRFAAQDRYEEIDDLPRRLRGTEAPRPPRAAPPQGEAGRGQVPATTPAARGSLQRAAAEEAGELTDAELEELDIVLYSTSWCGYCRKARRYFQDKGYPFVEKDIEQDRAAAAAFQQIAGRRGGVPVIVINGQVLRGFSPGHIDRAVGRALRGGG